MQGGVSVKGEDKEGRKGWRGSFYGGLFFLLWAESREGLRDGCAQIEARDFLVVRY
jgi:hypothetical protein